MPAAIHYDPEGYDTSRPKLMGRHAAGEGFLRAYARYARGDALHCYAASQAQFDDFERRVGAYATAREVRWIPHRALDALAQAGALHYPGPEIGDLAWHRRHVEPRAYSVTGVTHTIASHRGMDAIGDLLLAPVEAWDALICTSQAVRAAAEGILADWSEYLGSRFGAVPTLHAQLPVIPLGVDCDSLPETDEAELTRAALRSRYGMGNDDMVFLFLGRLSYHAKANPLPMYLALERAARETGKRLHLILAGWFPNDDIQKAFLDAASALCPSVRTVHVDGREPTVRRHIWCAANVFTSLVDNIQETFGLAPIEAMACGLPVVVSDWDGYRETVRHEIDGFVIPTVMAGPGNGEHLALRHLLGVDDYDHYIARASMSVAVDSEAAAVAYARLIQDPVLRRRMGAAGQQRARAAYDWRVVIPQYEDLWQELAQRRKSASAGNARPPVAPAHPLRADPFRVFAAYPSFALHPTTRVCAVPSASLAHLRELCHLRIVSVALDECGTATECDALLQSVGRTDWVEVRRVLSGFPAQRHAVLQRTLVWLAKVGLVRLSQPDETDPREQERRASGTEGMEHY